MTRYLFILSVLFLINACASPTKEDSKDIQATHSLKYEGDFSLPLDSVTSGISTYSQLYQPKTNQSFGFKSNQEYFAFLTRNDISIYDVKLRSLFLKIRLDSKGPNAMGFPMSFNIISPDSIYVWSYPMLYHINANGDILRKIQPEVFNKPIEPTPTTYAMPIIVDNAFYTGFNTNLPPSDLTAPIANDLTDGVILKIDLETEKSNLEYHLPSIYIREDLYSRYYYYASLANGMENETLVSFGADDSITVTDFKSKLNRYYAGSRMIDKINPRSNRKNEDDWDHFRLNFTYRGIIYDKYRKCYYRFLTLPKEQKDLDSGDMKTSRVKDISVIILDEKFNKIGETQFSKEFSDTMFFVSEEGLCVYNLTKTLTDEDNVHFGIFKLIINEM